MNRLKLFIVGATVMLSLTSFAVEYPWLSFVMMDNTEISVAADNLSINYSDKTLTLKSATVDQSIAVDRIKSMQFRSDLSGIDGINIDGAEEPATYYNTSGIEVGSFASVEEARESLPAGIYIVKNSVKSFKIIF